MKKKIATLALLPLLLLAACGQKQEAPKAGADGAAAANEIVVRVGHAAPLTGPQAHLGKDNENGVRLAIDELNAGNFMIGGKKARFEMLSEDDQSQGRIATTVAQKFVDEKVNGVIGHLNSGTTIPASKIYADAGIAQISPSATSPQYTAQGYKTAFRVMANDAQQGPALANFALQQLKAKRIAIIDDRTAYGQGLADEFEKTIKAAGAEVVGRESTTDTASDFTTILTRIKGLKPDLLFYAGMDPQAGPMATQMQTLGLKVQFMGGDGMQTPNFIKLAGKAGEGTIASLPGVPLEKMPGGAQFRERFTGKYGEIQLYAPYCYDAMMVLAQAMQRAGSTDPAVYLAEIPKTDYQGVTSRIRFDAKGDLQGGAVSLYQVKNGAWVYLTTMQ